MADPYTKNGPREIRLASDALLNQDKRYDYGMLLPFKARRGMDPDQLSSDYMQGDIRPAVPSILADIYNSAVKGGQMIRGERPMDPGEITEQAIEFLPGSLLAGRLVPKGPGVVLGMFAGRNAQTADLSKLKVAEKMAEKGRSRDEIWDQTGWFRFNDREGNPMGKWKFEVDDRSSRAVSDPAALKPYLTKTGRVKKGAGKTGYGPEIDKLLIHDELYKTYPGSGPTRVLAEIIRDVSNINEAVKKLQVRYGRGKLSEPEFRKQYNLLLQQKLALLDRVTRKELQELMQRGLPISDAPGGPAKTARERYPLLDRPIGETVVESTSTGSRDLYGYYKPGLNTMAVRRDMGTTEQERLDAFRSTSLHELQHAIQSREGFEIGGTAEEFGRGFKNRLTDPETGKRLTPFEIYQRLVAESEARLVQKRRDMGPRQRRALPPWTMLDESKLLTRVDLHTSRLGKELGVERGKAAGGFVTKPLYNDARIGGMI